MECALGYSTKARLLNSLVDAVCDVRDKLRTEYQDRPEIREIYGKVEKVSQHRSPLKRRTKQSRH